jgi:hypothetical protein
LLINDIIMSVVQAIRPSEAGKARGKLVALSGSPETGTPNFSESLKQAAKARKPVTTEDDLLLQVMKNAEPSRLHEAASRLAALGDAGTTTNFAGVSENTGEKLEASILTHLYGEMMPDESASIYGSGSSGQFWQQMLTEKMAEATAKRSPLGLAEQLGLADGQDAGGENRAPFISKFEVKSYAG